MVTREYRNSRLLSRGLGSEFDAFSCDSEDEWRELRRRGIGGSDVAPIMGISPFRTALDVWLEKTGRMDPPDLGDSEPVYWGTVNESNVAARFARDHPELTVQSVRATLVSRERPFMHANLDRVAFDADGTPSVLEIKTASAWKADEWESCVPLYYQTQVMEYLAVTGWPRAYVAVLIGGNDYREYEIGRDNGDIDAVRSACGDFWANYVEADVMPQVVGSDSGALADLYGVTSEELATPDDMGAADDLVAAYQSATKRERDAREAKADAAARLMALIGDSKGLLTDTSVVTWSRGSSTRLDTKRLRDEMPEVYERYQREFTRNGGLRIREAM